MSFEMLSRRMDAGATHTAANKGEPEVTCPHRRNCREYLKSFLDQVWAVNHAREIFTHGGKISTQYLVCSLSNKLVQKCLVTAKTSTTESKMLSIKRCLVIDSAAKSPEVQR